MRPRTADYEMKPMLCDETEDQNPGASFAAFRAARQRARTRVSREDSAIVVGVSCSNFNSQGGRSEASRRAAEPPRTIATLPQGVS